MRGEGLESSAHHQVSQVWEREGGVKVNYIKTQLMSGGLKMAVDEMFNERCSFIVGSEMPGIGFTQNIDRSCNVNVNAAQ